MAKHLWIIHGYSDGSQSFGALRDFLVQVGGYDPQNVRFVDYASMDDEADFRDFADKIDAEYEARRDKLGPGFRVDVACHSTGGLVVRAWLALRRAREEGMELEEQPCPVHRLLMFAPANFGSDLADLGKSFLQKFRLTFFSRFTRPGDWMESGRKVLEGLAPASPFQWELSGRDLHERHYFSSDEPYGGEPCFPFVFAAGCFTKDASAALIKQRVKPGTDGTIRICGASLNTRKCVVDFRDEPPRLIWEEEHKFDDIPFAVFQGFDHGSIVNSATEGFTAANGPGPLVELALRVTDPAAYEAAAKKFAAASVRHYSSAADAFRAPYQQFFFRVQDDVGYPVRDYYLDFFVTDARGNVLKELTHEFDELFEAEFYTHRADASCRVMMVNCARLDEFNRKIMVAKARLMAHITAVSDVPNVAYRSGKCIVFDSAAPRQPDEWSFFYPNTTTLVDIVVNRRQTDKLAILLDPQFQPDPAIPPEDTQEPVGRALLVSNPNVHRVSVA